MALSAIVTKNTMAVDVNGIYNISVNLTLTDDAVEVLNQNFSQTHNPANDISVARNMLLEKIQTAINNYKTNKTAHGSVAFTNAITYINTKI